MCVGGSQGPTRGGRAVGVTGAGEGAVAIAMEGRWMAKGWIRKGECLRTLRVALHTARKETKTRGEREDGLSICRCCWFQVKSRWNNETEGGREAVGYREGGGNLIQTTENRIRTARRRKNGLKEKEKKKGNLLDRWWGGEEEKGKEGKEVKEQTGRKGKEKDE